VCKEHRKKKVATHFGKIFNEKQSTVLGCLGAGVALQRLQPGEQCCASVRHLLIEVFVHKRAQDSGENAAAAFVRHVSHGQQVEVAQQAVGDGVAPAPWGPHGRHKLGVNDLLESAWRPPFIPSLQHCTCSFGSFLPLLSTEVVRLFQVHHSKLLLVQHAYTYYMFGTEQRWCQAWQRIQLKVMTINLAEQRHVANWIKQSF